MDQLGEWQKEYVDKLVIQGVPHDFAMLAMGLTCEERQKAYMQGYEMGYNDKDKLIELDVIEYSDPCSYCILTSQDFKCQICSDTLSQFKGRRFTIVKQKES